MPKPPRFRQCECWLVGYRFALKPICFRVSLKKNNLLMITNLSASSDSDALIRRKPIPAQNLVILVTQQVLPSPSIPVKRLSPQLPAEGGAVPEQGPELVLCSVTAFLSGQVSSFWFLPQNWKPRSQCLPVARASVARVPPSLSQHSVGAAPGGKAARRGANPGSKGSGNKIPGSKAALIFAAGALARSDCAESRDLPPAITSSG